MKSRMEFFRKTLFLILLGGTSAIGQVVTWDAEYLGINLLTAPWGQIQPSRMATNPPETWLAIQGSQGDAMARMGVAGVPGSTWAPTTSATIEFSLTLTLAGTTSSYAQGLYVFAGNLSWNLMMDPTRLRLEGTSASSRGAPLGLNENIYRLVISDGVADLYLNDSPVPVIAGMAGSTAVSQTSLYVGDWGSLLSGNGQWNYIRWNNTQAFSVVPEPTTTGLILGAILLGVLYVRKRNANIESSRIWSVISERSL